MIKALKRWIINTVRDDGPVPHSVSNGGPPMMSIYKIENGYLVHKFGANGYREDARITFCPTPLDVAKQIVNTEALAKMGFKDADLATAAADAMKISGYATGKLTAKPFNPNSVI
jgi:hypothetical protein